MSSDEIKETSKAIQEVAKTTGIGINSLEKIVGFFAQKMDESVEAVCGMLADTLKIKRYERQFILVEKTKKRLKEKGLSVNIRFVPPKLAIPIFQGASLEDDETLHDLWVNLLVSALNPACEKPRSAFISIIRQLEPIDVKMLNHIYKIYKQQFRHKCAQFEHGIYSYIRKSKGKAKDSPKEWKHKEMRRERFLSLNPPTEFSISQDVIKATLNIDSNIYWNSIDNLIRQRLVSTYISLDQIPLGERDDEGTEGMMPMTFSYGYKRVCLTAIGVSFVEACYRGEQEIDSTK